MKISWGKKKETQTESSSNVEAKENNLEDLYYDFEADKNAVSAFQPVFFKTPSINIVPNLTLTPQEEFSSFSQSRRKRSVPTEENDLFDSRKLAELKTKLIDLEKEKQLLKNQLEETSTTLQTKLSKIEILQLNQQNQLLESKKQLEIEIEKNKILQKQLSENLKNQALMTEKMNQLQSESNLSSSDLASELAQLRKANRSLQSKLELSNDQVKNFEKKLESMKFQQQQQVIQLQSQLNVYQSKEKYVSSKLSESTSISVLQDKIQVLELEIQNQKNQLQRVKDLEKENQFLSTELTRLKELEKINEKLQRDLKLQQEFRVNLEILYEEKDDLRKKLQRYTDLESQIVSLQLENEKLKSQQQQKADDIAPELISARKQISILQHEKEQLIVKLSNREFSDHPELLQLKTSLSQMQNQIEQLKLEKELLQKELDQQSESLKLLDKRNSSLKRERDGMRTILDSYNELGSNQQYELLKSRIQELEQSRIEREEYIESLESKAGGKRKEDSSLLKENNALKIKVDQLTLEISKREKEINNFMSEIALLQSRLGKGEFDKKQTKVLHLTMNPESQLHSKTLSTVNEKELEQLREENERLKKLVNVSNPSVVGNFQHLEELEKEKLDLQQKLDDSQKRHQRVLELAKKKIHQFREIVYELFGYHIEMESKKYTLHSMYAEKEGDHLIFQTSSKGKLDLLSTEFAETLNKEVRTYLETCHSIPAFMSAITLELFGSKTFSGGIENTKK